MIEPEYNGDDDDFYNDENGDDGFKKFIINMIT